MENEQWKWIEGVEGKYEISSHGKVRSHFFRTPRVMTTHLNEHGYPEVSLKPRRPGQTRKVHRLVAQAFLPNPLNLPLVHHRDTNRRNALLSNLEWATYSQNT